MDYEALEVRIKAATGLLDEILQVAETHRLIFYKGGVATHIPKSYGAHAFHTLQRTNLNYLIVRLCALWDSRDDTIGLKGVFVRITPEIITEAKQRAEAAYAPPGPNPSANEQNCRQRLGLENADRAELAIQQATDRFKVVKIDERFATIQRMRHKAVAHAGFEPRRNKPSRPSFILGDEEWLIEQSIYVLQRLYAGINGTSYSFEDSRLIYRRQAKGFWSNLDFSNVE